MQCSKAQRWISTGLDVPMDESQSEALRRHLTACTECRQFEAELRECVTLLGRVPIPDPSSEFTNEVILRLGSQEPNIPVRRELLRPVPIGLVAASFLFGTMLSVWAQSSQSSNAMGGSNNQSLSEGDLVDFGAGDDLSQLVATILPEMGE